MGAHVGRRFGIKQSAGKYSHRPSCILLTSTSSTEHRVIDLLPPRATLFLHEDIAKTLQFERELKEWRIAEVQAGRGDPGRPGYAYVFLTVRMFFSLYAVFN